MRKVVSRKKSTLVPDFNRDIQEPYIRESMPEVLEALLTNRTMPAHRVRYGRSSDRSIARASSMSGNNHQVAVQSELLECECSVDLI